MFFTKQFDSTGGFVSSPQGSRRVTNDLLQSWKGKLKRFFHVFSFPIRLIRSSSVAFLRSTRIYANRSAIRFRFPSTSILYAFLVKSWIYYCHHVAVFIPLIRYREIHGSVIQLKIVMKLRAQWLISDHRSSNVGVFLLYSYLNQPARAQHSSRPLVGKFTRDWSNTKIERDINLHKRSLFWSPTIVLVCRLWLSTHDVNVSLAILGIK